MFRRTVDGQVLDFGTTGLLRFSNLVMYDRQTESWWQEFNGEAVVGELTGKKLEFMPLSIVSWMEFKTTFPKGKVLSRDTGHRRPYGENPYIFYDSSGDPFLYEGSADRRLPALERVLAVEVGKESLAIPYTLLQKEPVIHYNLAGQEMVVFFKQGTASALDRGLIAEGRDVGSAAAFDPHVDGKKLTFRSVEDHFIDEQTGSLWNLLGKAEAGPLTGKELKPQVYRAAQFWFSWVVFRPDTIIYKGKAN
ncbi:MAG: DUF3179 domain-containing protein [Chloroflexi bacterium]|nr:DUF3179 domain-containing protein [Chloroflexota bacterium]